MVAYFSMEIGIDPDVPTYAGGLGVLKASGSSSMCSGRARHSATMSRSSISRT